MKVTVKQIEAKKEERKDLKNLREVAFQNEDYSMVVAIDASLEAIEEFFKLVSTKTVSYWCGQRKFYEEVYQIGKTFFTSSFTKMTKSRGFRSIIEIDEITEKNVHDMLSDVYYY